MNRNVARLMDKKRLRVVGLMSGTSADGVDAAVVDIDSDGVSVKAFEMFPYSASLRDSIFRLFAPETSGVDDICHFNFVLGEVFADAVVKLCKLSGIPLNSIDLIGSHGQTIYHNPGGRQFDGRTICSTLQIGEASVIAQQTGVTTVADFRPRDMAAGGQGGPLVPYADYVLFADKQKSRAVQNIGGIANVTYLPAGCDIEHIVAFDTGPGNMVIDRIMSIITDGKERFDRDGAMGAKGQVNQMLLDEILTHPFFTQCPPRTTGREEFGSQYTDALYKMAQGQGISDSDIVTTATALTAVSIARAYSQFLPAPPDEIILCGGGASNRTLVEMLRQHLGDAEVLSTDDFGIDSDAKEAVSFAILAHATIKGTVNNIPSATGATKPVILGKIIPA
jgi:anhydro-N-acetylmuramic acid kinase